MPELQLGAAANSHLAGNSISFQRAIVLVSYCAMTFTTEQRHVVETDGPVQITSNVTRSHESTQHFIDPTHPDWQGSALRRASVINCSNIAYVRQKHVVHVIGVLSPPTMTDIDECLKVALGIR